MCVDFRVTEPGYGATTLTICTDNPHEPLIYGPKAIINRLIVAMDGETRGSVQIGEHPLIGMFIKANSKEQINRILGAIDEQHFSMMPARFSVLIIGLDIGPPWFAI